MFTVVDHRCMVKLLLSRPCLSIKLYVKGERGDNQPHPAHSMRPQASSEAEFISLLAGEAELRFKKLPCVMNGKFEHQREMTTSALKQGQDLCTRGREKALRFRCHRAMNFFVSAELFLGAAVPG
jgi:hypothetical protein